MKKLYLLFWIFCSHWANAQLTAVVGTSNATALAQMMAGSGVTVSNAGFFGHCDSAVSAGKFFASPNSVFGLDSGIVLSTGNVVTSPTAVGVNILSSQTPGTCGAAQFASANTNGGSDPDLVVLGSSITINDACVLEFDFTPLGDTIKFEYVFGSEEYDIFNCSINDIFGFFISGPGITGPYSGGSANIALVPGTTFPVAISTINNGLNAFPGSSCFNNTGGLGPFTQYYVSNIDSFNAGIVTNMSYTGFSKTLTAIAVVQPCSTYHLKLAVGDASDNIYDTGVFLKAASLQSNIISVKLKAGLGGSNPYVIEGCDSAKLTFTRRIISGTVLPDTVHMVIGGTAQNGIDYLHVQDTVIFTSNINDTLRTIDIFAYNDGIPEGSEYIMIYIQSGCSATITDSIKIEIRDSLSFTLLNHDTAICLGNSVNVTGLVDSGINILWTPPNGVLNQQLLNTVISPAQTGTQYYTVTGTYATCTPVSKGFTIKTDPVPVISPLPDIELCEGEQVQINATVNPPFAYNISWIPSTDLINTTGYSPTFVGTTSQNIDFTVTSPNAGCTATDQFHVQVWPFAAGAIMDDTIVCDGDPIQLWVSGGNGQYLWYPATNLSCDSCANPVVSTLGTETYYAVLLDPHGCQDTLDVMVTIEPPFTMNLLNNDTTIYMGESVQLMVEGTAPFLFWTPTDYLGFSQSHDPVATPLEDITYVVTGVSLFNGCPKTDSVRIHVIMQDVFVPNAFSPNGDGLNDLFKVTCRKLINVEEFRILNRWGNVVFSTNDIRQGWDGKYKGVPQDPGVYYYMMHVSYPNGKTAFLKGDITLLR